MRDRDGLGERGLHQFEGFLRSLGDVHGRVLIAVAGGREAALRRRAPTPAARSSVASGRAVWLEKA